MKDSLPPILYAKQEINGVLVRADSRQVIRKGIEGHPIDVYSGGDYINLYHVFDRLTRSDKKRYGDLKIVRRQLAGSRWRIFIVKDVSTVPEMPLDPGYDPKRGRYKRYAEALAAGETIELPTRTEAIKVRRAWQLYVPRAKRRHLHPIVRKFGTEGKHTVQIQAQKA